MAAQNSFALIMFLGLVVASATAQSDSCNAVVPASLATTFSGLSCRPVWKSFVLRHSLDKNNNVLSIVLSASYSTGWVGMGFSKDGFMVGSSAMVGWIDNSGVGHLKQFYLRGQTTSQVLADQGNLLTTSVQPTAIVENGIIYLAFKLNYSAPVGQQPILLAFSSYTPSSNSLVKHDDKASLSFDFSSGTVASSSFSYPSNLKRAHGVLAIVGWGVLLPIGAIVARHCRKWDPLWYHLHIVIQIIGFLIGLAAIITGKSLYNKLHVTVYTHRAIGFIVLVMGILQVIAVVLRTHKDSKWRKYWNWYHHWVGRIAILLAAVNIVIGIRAGAAGKAWKIGYGFNLGVLLLVSIILEVFSCARRSKRNSAPTGF